MLYDLCHAADHPNRPSQSTSLSWTDFFTQELYLEETDRDANLNITHHVYLIPPSESAPLFVMHHGAGSSGLSFAACAGEIRKMLPKAGILSLDCRDHGSTQVTKADDGSSVEMDLTLETLSRDLVFVIRETQSKMGWGQDLPDIVLVGHSLGGAVVTDVAKQGELGQKLLAYAVLDVVEGMHIHPTVYTQMIMLFINYYDRLCNGCSPEYGEISLYETNPFPISSIGNRMAHSFPHHPEQNLSTGLCSLPSIRRDATD